MLKNRVLCQYNATAIHHNRARFADITPLRWYRYGATADTKLRDNYNILQKQSQVGFDPVKFALGFLGGAVGSKAVSQGFKVLKDNPQIKEALKRELADTLACVFYAIFLLLLCFNEAQTSNLAIQTSVLFFVVFVFVVFFCVAALCCVYWSLFSAIVDTCIFFIH